MQILENISLQLYNTFAVAAPARQLLILESEADVIQFLPSDQRLFILGEGSNVLFTGAFEGLIVLNRIKSRQITKETEDSVFVRLGAGENWHDTVCWAVQNNYGGIENLSYIPGTVGAAPIQNIGAYGVEVCQVISEVEAFEIRTGHKRLFSREECRFGYRDSIFKQELLGQYLITAVTLQLCKSPTKFELGYKDITDTLARLGYASPSLRGVHEAIIAIRRQKLYAPSEMPNAGSFFKNPIVGIAQAEALRASYPEIPIYPISGSSDAVKISAAWLIERAGWKGRYLGAAAVSPKHALVLTNPEGRATGAEVWALAEAIQSDVKKNFGIALEAEVWKI